MEGGPRKVLVLSTAMRGHVLPNALVALWLQEQGHTVYFGLEGKVEVGVLSKLRNVRIASAEEVSPQAIRDKEAVFESLSQTSTTYRNSLYQMLKRYVAINIYENYFLPNLRFAIRLVDELQPDVVVCETQLNQKNSLYTHCSSKQIPLICLLNPGRPDKCFNPNYFIRACLPDLKMLGRLMEIVQAFEATCRSDLGMKDGFSEDQPLSLMPGSAALVQERPFEHEFYVGPILDAPLPQPTSGWSSLVRPSALEADRGVVAFLRASTLPVVYVALGTLVAVSQELVQRLVAALRSIECVVLWSMPQDQQARLLGSLSLPPSWRIEAWVPQREVLASGSIKCFLSHCGCSSSHEAMVAGVPMVCLPFFLDQFEWADSVVAQRAGVRVSKSASQRKIQKAIQSVLTTPSYAVQAQAVAKRLQSESVSPELASAGLPGAPVAGDAILKVARGEEHSLRKARAAAAKERGSSTTCCAAACVLM